MANKINVFIIVSCAFVIKCTALAYEAPSRCFNPNGRIGLCVSIYDCPSVLHALKANAFTFARRSECVSNGEGHKPFVCCTSDTGFTARSQRVIFPKDDDYDENVTTAPTRITKTIATASDNSSLFPKPPECGPITIGNKIYGGEETELGEFPWLANLEYKKTNRGALVSVCAGNIINQRYLLTAAHCVKGKIEIEAGQLVSVRVGDHNTQSSVDCNSSGCLDAFQRLGVAKIIVHRDYGSNNGYYNQNDIALIRTDRSIQYTFAVAPVCLPDADSQRSALTGGMKLAVAGWGHTGTSKYSAVKRKVELPYVENEVCPFRLTPEQLCAGGEYKKDSCSGDSGGGLVRVTSDAWIVEGIVSYGRGCGLERPAVYTRVSSYISWIYHNVQP